MVGVLHPTRRKNESKNLGRHLELNERRRAFSRKKQRGKRAVRQAARMTDRAARARFQLDELKFFTFNVRTAAVNGVDGIDHIGTLLRPCAAKRCGSIGLQEIKRDIVSEIVAPGYRVYFSGDCSGVKGMKRQHRGGSSDKRGDR